MPFVFTLIGHAARALTEKDVKNAGAALASGGHALGRYEWLALGEACDVFAEGDIQNARRILHSWAGAETLDVIVQPPENRRKKALLADMESTIIEQEMLDELAARVGIGDEVKAITKRSMNGEMDFMQALAARFELLKGRDAAVVNDLARIITYMPGAEVLIATLRKHNCRCVLISGGFTRFTARVAEKLGFHENYGNILEIEHGRFTGRLVPPVIVPASKLEQLQKTAASLGVPLEDTCAVGDGANDIPMLQAAGLGIGFRAKPVVTQNVPHRIRFAGLRALLWAQGYKKEELA
ncbi:MAG TPA: phosphoserine phosphatase SerB [Alphaproteobacteria bacterium]|nr:phosphoserine phosphatase SerB [Alphaproteobacteria bacterium]